MASWLLTSTITLHYTPWLDHSLSIKRSLVVQAAVQERILTFVTEPAFARRLYTTPEIVRRAAEETLRELKRPKLTHYSSHGGHSCRLAFRHTCL